MSEARHTTSSTRIPRRVTSRPSNRARSTCRSSAHRAARGPAPTGQTTSSLSLAETAHIPGGFRTSSGRSRSAPRQATSSSTSPSGLSQPARRRRSAATGSARSSNTPRTSVARPEALQPASGSCPKFDSSATRCLRSRGQGASRQSEATSASFLEWTGRNQPGSSRTSRESSASARLVGPGSTLLVGTQGPFRRIAATATTNSK